MPSLDGGPAAKPADCPFGAASMIMRTTYHNVQIGGYSRLASARAGHGT
jgi:hypothetical protein